MKTLKTCWILTRYCVFHCGAEKFMVKLNTCTCINVRCIKKVMWNLYTVKFLMIFKSSNLTIIFVHEFMYINVQVYIRLYIYLGSIKFLDDVLAFFAGVTNTHKLYLPMVYEQSVSNDLNNREGRFPSGNWAIFNIPEDTNRWETVRHTELNIWRN